MKEPVVFIPGLLCTEILYAPQIAAFSDHPILVADHKGHDSIAAIAENVLEKAPDRFALTGLSWAVTSPWKSCGSRRKE